MSNRVTHFEIPCDDPEKTMKFFTSVFGWKFQSFGDNYWIVETGAGSNAGINGGLMKKRDPRQPVVNSINVENLDSAIANVVRAGGQMVVPKMAIPRMGWLAYFKDPDGNIHGVYQDDPAAK